MKKIIIILFSSFSSIIFAHSNHNEKNEIRRWNIAKENITIDGSFYMYKNDEVFIEDLHSKIIHFSFVKFSNEDQLVVLTKDRMIKDINTQILNNNKKSVSAKSFFGLKFWLIIGFLSLFGLLIQSFFKKKKLNYLIPILFVGITIMFYSFTKKEISGLQTTLTSLAFVDSAFATFKPNVNTYYTSTYFYVESKGIPTTHTMMVGISSTGWQQQVPLPKCYIGTNAWPVPINPVIAPTPVPVNASHFTKGAIAIAVNGVPIFNPYTNTGVDAFLDGQLDTYGGHCGRGDDYHYHTAPLHLYGVQTQTLPIAFALDGHAVYGIVEPDGNAMLALDVNHGHYRNGIYHYHGTAAAPYMIGSMVGAVTEDATKQIIPQPQGAPIRTENWGPLPGALITSCLPNNTNNGYNIVYTLNGNTGYATNYSWLGTTYTFSYVTPASTSIINYTGLAQCTVPSSITENLTDQNSITVFPNPTSDILNFNLSKSIKETDIKQVTICSLKGDVVYKAEGYKQNIDIKHFTNGTYIIKVILNKTQFVKKLIIQ